MLQMTLHLTRSSRLWTFQLLGFEVSIEMHKGAIFDRYVFSLIVNSVTKKFLFENKILNNVCS
jgi:hypothetical protein